MIQIKQTTSDILEKLSELEVDPVDDLMREVLDAMMILRNEFFTKKDFERLLDENFEVGSMIIRSFYSMSKDSFRSWCRNQLPDGASPGVKSFRKLRFDYVESIVPDEKLSLINSQVSRKYSWQDIIGERLISGRGSAISGQRRGKLLEDFVEEILTEVFGDKYDTRVSFTGKRGKDIAKCDFAIPDKENPQIVIEVKAYAATGSKQSDVLGDINKIIQVKRPDTFFLLVTDGVSWYDRKSDLNSITNHQNQGDIYRIYTQKMGSLLKEDLLQMKKEKGL